MPRCVLVIPSADRRRLLAMRIDDRAELPTVTIETDWIAAEVGAIQAAARDTLGIETIVLREIAGASETLAAELECLTALPRESPGDFVEVSRLLTMATGDTRSIIARWQTEAPDAALPPWAAPGWIRGVTAWMDERLAALGESRSGPLRQIKGAWADSAVLAADSSAGEVYFKAAARHSAEPAVLAALDARGRPGAPPVLAIENANKWMLMRAAPGRPAVPARFADALRQFAALQRAEAPYTAAWLGAGLPGRGTVALRARLVRVLVDIPSQLHRGGLLSAAETAALRQCVARAELLCDRLAACGVPDSLAHDDFQPGNVVDDGRAFVFLDWSDVAVAHPFFSAHHFIGAAEDSLSGTLRDAYLAPWVELVGHAAANDAFTASAPLAPVYRAIFNDDMPDYEAWLATDPPRAQREFARGVFTSILSSLSAEH